MTDVRLSTDATSATLVDALYAETLHSQAAHPPRSPRRPALQVTCWQQGDVDDSFDNGIQGRIETLKLQQDSFSRLEKLELWHKIDSTSPLGQLRLSGADLLMHIEEIEVVVHAFDIYAEQEVSVQPGKARRARIGMSYHRCCACTLIRFGGQ